MAAPKKIWQRSAVQTVLLAGLLSTAVKLVPLLLPQHPEISTAIVDLLITAGSAYGITYGNPSLKP